MTRFRLVSDYCSPSQGPSSVRTAARQIVALGWVIEERFDDVAAWLEQRWYPGFELSPELRAQMNEELPPAVADDPTHDERDWIEPVIAHIERATGLLLTERVRQLIGLGVVDGMRVMCTDRGRGYRVARGIIYARAEQGKNRGLRAELADHPGVTDLEAGAISRVLIGTAAMDKYAYPHLRERSGMSGALPSWMLGLPVTVKTAVAWGQQVTHAVDPTITSTALRRQVTRRIQARYRDLPGRCLAPVPADCDLQRAALAYRAALGPAWAHAQDQGHIPANRIKH